MREIENYGWRLLELRYEKPIRQIIVDSFAETGNMSESARRLGIKPSTFYKWVYRLGIEIRREAVVAAIDAGEQS